MQVYCSKQHANNGGNRFCTHCGEPLPLAVKQVVDNRYRIIRQLGQGGFGRTYLAEDIKKSHKTCVLKEFAPQVEHKEDLQKAKELFEREANVLKKLQHSQIPRFHGSLQAKIGTKDFFFLVQDYVEGDNYLQLLEQRQTQGKTFTEEEVITLLRQILPVLIYIHSQNTVHRDISPDNLILRRSDNLPVLIDFGGVKQLPASQGFWSTKLAGNNTLLGKKGYAPEEQLRQGKVFINSDLYSLAVTALVLLTGKEPQKLYDSYQGVWRWGKEINASIQLESVLKRMLAYKPGDRYQNAAQILTDLPSPSSLTKPPTTHLTKIKTMVVSPGRKVTVLAGKLHNKTQAVSQKLPLPVWLRPFAVSFGGTALVVLTGAGTWALVNSVVRGVSSITIPSISLPELPSLPNPLAQPVSDKNKTSSSEVLSRRQQLEIPETFFIQITDSLFYAQKPELKGRSLTSKPEDAPLRDQWHAVAGEFLNKIEQANLSTAARRKLGSYTQKDYENWRRQARSGQLGNYTASQLNKDTNEKFDQLFPGQQRGKLNQQTFGQVWYAIAADQVSKAQSK
ncbi:serine/threonine protein kinase [Trichormus variabilis ATCC 29413]|uniref:non-specific serine/threonine protein kinase n=2 Tax=Anabaena variabilis TaxID=264691 RepID=Q3MGP1_TRIV2|nr:MULTISPECIES: serine/threonine-protein kinase [Nostocaceae]ABA19845.1 serine/threonine protein kinase [Trichormus variabilis ATCC 29413]MBC1215044.1 serine/threonine protein kinase [Trichormus variabilis ARAD]MBC1255701.1 serine/threonine protein kinase [Trichormus variabilis V5]MBC1268350.1 serine/threonine protein kinase [Trichormus variabilis FSR]MBC1302552.1 serine/threonine protein kinase [Trichormus variabilis N2B]